MQRLRGWITTSAVAVFLTASVPLVAASKTDDVVFLNGDRLTGEVKRLLRGQLHFKTDATGTIQIESDDVASLESRQTLEVECNSGEHFWGTLVASEAGRLTVITEEGPRSFDLPSVVALTPIEKGFWKKLDGSIDLGLSHTEADDRTQLSFSAEASYRSRRLWRGLSYDGIQTSQPRVEDIERHDLRFELVRAQRRPRRVWTGVTSL